VFSVTDPSPTREVFYALCLEALFLVFCIILVGYGLSEIKRQQNKIKNTVMIILGIASAVLSFFVTKLFIQG